ncbi:MAG: hypothetical protein HZA58_05535 [Acidimicrobiia bacterium]|nr:hypothetical protein [Acidimicrobiia bacterium]
MHLWRLITLVGTGFAALAMAFPFATLPVLGIIGGIEADAWPALLPLTPVAAAAVFGDRERGLRPPVAIAVILTACLAVLFAVFKLSDALVAVNDTAGASLGAGAFVLLGGTLIALAGTATALSRS